MGLEGEESAADSHETRFFILIDTHGYHYSRRILRAVSLHYAQMAKSIGVDGQAMHFHDQLTTHWGTYLGSIACGSKVRLEVMHYIGVDLMGSVIMESL